MNELVVKNVDVLGDSIMAAKDSEGNIWAGVNYFCKALGMDKKQRDWQVKKVKEDKTLSKGCRELPAGVFDIGNSVYSLRLDFIPIWLAKIAITNKMEQDHPELAEKLLEYQLKAKDILAEAFFPKKKEIPMTIPEQIQLLAQGNVELNKRMDNMQSEIESIKLDLPILPIEADKITTAVKHRGVFIMDGKQSNAYKNKGLRQKVYCNIYSNLKYQFGVKSYKSIKRSECDKALEIIENYEPPYYLEQEILAENAQQKLEF